MWRIFILEPRVCAEAEGLSTVVLLVRKDLRNIETHRTEGGIPVDREAGAGPQAGGIISSCRW